MPFWPGGFDDAVIELIDTKTSGSSTKGFRTVAPGLPRGLRLPGDPIEDEELVAIDGTELDAPYETEDMVRDESSGMSLS